MEEGEVEGLEGQKEVAGVLGGEARGGDGGVRCGANARHRAGEKAPGASRISQGCSTAGLSMSSSPSLWQPREMGG